MIAQEIRKFDMLRRVQRFLDGAAAKLHSVNATAARKELDQLVAEMGVNERAQATSTLNAKSQTAEQAVLRRDLVKHHMRPVVTIAAAHLRDVAGFKALRLPPDGVRVAVLIEAATAMAEAARAHEQVFVENGRPADFADALLMAAAGVRASIDARARSITSGVGARAGLKATASRAHLVLRMLDAQVQSALADDPKALAEWESAKRIGKGKVLRRDRTFSQLATAAREPSLSPFTSNVTHRDSERAGEPSTGRAANGARASDPTNGVRCRDRHVLQQVHKLQRPSPTRRILVLGAVHIRAANRRRLRSRLCRPCGHGEPGLDAHLARSALAGLCGTSQTSARHGSLGLVVAALPHRDRRSRRPGLAVSGRDEGDEPIRPTHHLRRRLL